MAVVEVIDEGSRRRAIATLVLAFAGDPIIRWHWSDAHAYATYFPRMIDAFGGRAFDHGSAHGLEDVVAVALWLPPGVGPDAEALMKVMRESMDDDLLGEVGEIVGQMEQLHPTEEHWYLPLAGVDPPLQGRGLGSALLRHGLATCDRDGLPAYLEATSEGNRDLYLRLGFEITGVIQAGSSPPMWAMLRPPA